ncbi:hypothetical protein [Propionivibrio sp.]|uniref:hypothetical protein n=1 Tax=Propionivibrio sp. TaxID=2212460 RepID=UPI0039E3134F
MMMIQIEIPDILPQGHGTSFKKGIADSLLELARTPINHTSNGHEESRQRGKEVGKCLAQEIAHIVKKPLRS